MSLEYTKQEHVGRYAFQDRSGQACELLDSELQAEDTIKLTCSIERDYFPFATLHLTREQIAELMPLLQFFVAHGRLPSPIEAKEFQKYFKVPQ